MAKATMPIDVLMAREAMPTILQRIEVTDAGCWEWQGHRNLAGYGDVRPAVGVSTPFKVHRVTWVAANGRDIPEDWTIDHLCKNPPCCNPDHLEPVTLRDNLLRGSGWAGTHASRTHCPRGHAYEGGNLIVQRGRRHCAACRKAREKERARLLALAREATGLSSGDYTARYGRSVRVARELIAGDGGPR